MKKILVIGSLNMDFVAGVSHIPTIGETILLQECGLEKDLRTNAELLQRKGGKEHSCYIGWRRFLYSQRRPYRKKTVC